MANTDRGRNLEAFIAGQNSFLDPSGQGADYPHTNDSVRVLTASAEGGSPVELREDKTGSNSAIPGMPQRMTASASVELYLGTTGGATNGPGVIQNILQGAGFEFIDTKTVATTVSGGSSTATKVDCTDSAGLVVGGGIRVENKNYLGEKLEYEVRRIQSIDASGSPHLVQVRPALSFVPANTALVKGCVTAHPADSRDENQNSLSVWVQNDNSFDRALGWVPDTVSISLGGDTAPRVTISGTARSHLRGFATQLSAAISSTADPYEATIQNNRAVGSSSELGVGTHWAIDNEIVSIMAIDTSDPAATKWWLNRAELGSSVATHLINAPVTPYSYGVNFTGGGGEPAPPTSGAVFIAGNYNAPNIGTLQIGATTFDVGAAVGYQEDHHGDAFKVGGYVQTAREVKATMSGWTNLQTLNEGNILDTFNNQISFCIQQGDGLGGIVGVIVPQYLVEVPALDRGADEVTFEFSGRCVASTSDFTEMMIFWG